jgi:hypothetical protein
LAGAAVVEALFTVYDKSVLEFLEHEKFFLGRFEIGGSKLLFSREKETIFLPFD